MLVARLRKIAHEEADAGIAAEFRKRAGMIEAGSVDNLSIGEIGRRGALVQ